MEISNNPESMTEKEKEDMTKLFESFKALVKSCEPYSNVEPVLKNTASTLSERFYHVCRIGGFHQKNEISFKELNETIVNDIPKEFIWEISIARINLVISKMIRLGLVEAIETDNKDAPDFKITDDGIKAAYFSNISHFVFLQLSNLSTKQKSR